ncbi:MAG: hypothetical protein MAG581_00966 [Deltaproteobacteria bacterium]|nr:hypothetical protein [Deltaproteobacteria bacterium]
MRYNILLQSLAGLGTALCFSSSSIFIRYGLETIPSPLIGVTIGMVFCTFAYGLILLVRFNIKTEEEKKLSYSRQGILLLIFCGIFLGFGTLSRWIAIDLAPIAVVIGLSGLTVPVVLMLSPIIMGRSLENVTMRLWLGAGLVVIGASLITFSR